MLSIKTTAVRVFGNFIIMNLRKNYKATSAACMMGFISQACVNGFVPLLFVTISQNYGISLPKLTALITINFTVQLTVDFLTGKYADKIGVRRCLIFAGASNLTGMLSLALLTSVLESYIYGVLIFSTVCNAVGGGLYEVLASPIYEACPRENKTAGMALLHSSYCFGMTAVILLSTVFFSAFGIESWRILALIYALLPVLCVVLFIFVPINKLVSEDRQMTGRELLHNKQIWIFILLMIAGGASELAMEQWSSAFAEATLGVDKTVGDIAGTCLFSLSMALSRVLYSKLCDKMKIERFILISAGICILCYLTAAMSALPALSLAACALCGIGAAVLWPGTLSLAQKKCPTGGTVMFAALALAGDVGCSVGPSLTGYVSGAFSDNLRVGFIFALIFPVLLILGVSLLHRYDKRNRIK